MCKINSRIMLYVVETAQKRSKGPAEGEFATICAGTRIDDTLYMTQVSDSHLLAENEVLVVKVQDRLRTPLFLVGFAQYVFNTDPDQLPAEYHKLKIIPFEELGSEIQHELDRAILEYNNHWVA